MAEGAARRIPQVAYICGCEVVLAGCKQETRGRSAARNETLPPGRATCGAPTVCLSVQGRRFLRGAFLDRRPKTPDGRPRKMFWQATRRTEAARGGPTLPLERQGELSELLASCTTTA